jgi:hypothetical protein
MPLQGYKEEEHSSIIKARNMKLLRDLRVTSKAAKDQKQKDEKDRIARELEEKMKEGRTENKNFARMMKNPNSLGDVKFNGDITFDDHGNAICVTK